MLMDIRSCQWDQELLREFDIPESMLPEIKNNDYNFGTIKSNHSFPITGVIGDQQSALFGPRLSFLRGHEDNFWYWLLFNG